MDLCHVRCACMAGPKSVNKMVIFFVWGRVGVGAFIGSFFPDSFPSPRGVVFSPFPFSSLVSLLCPLNFFIYSGSLTASRLNKTTKRLATRQVFCFGSASILAFVKNCATGLLHVPLESRYSI
ncbi:hypothetical protein VIGAN_03280800 [Vigna angularis var. angularis]|uniref:Uncharacterized protein n=1 Tax=Vigna angularis var. angularis TaxID=157739 RepID=A0A0S3RQ94_PHAAN|nr:hypothetical protein VIGAN_03280800 [Vigna angularis var. angularis]